MSKKYYDYNLLPKKTCPFCGDETVLDEGKQPPTKCPHCKMCYPKGSDFLFGIQYAGAQVKSLVESYDAHCDNVSTEAKKAFESGGDYATRKHGTEQYVQSEKDVLHRRSDGDFEIRTEQSLGVRNWVEKEDWDRAFSCFEKAARGGHLGGLRRVGEFYCRGRGVEEDIETGFALLCKAAAGGSIMARKWLWCGQAGLASWNGWSNAPHGFEILKACADKGWRWAQYYLGRMYYEGVGVDKDFELGKQLVLAAAEPFEGIDLPTDEINGGDQDLHGFWAAKRRVCLCYFDGLFGFEQNIDLAIEYFYRLTFGSMREVDWEYVQSVSTEMLDHLDLWEGDGLKWRGKCDALYAGVRELKEGNFDKRQYKALLYAAVKEYSKKHNAGWLHVVNKNDVKKIKAAFNREEYLFLGKIGLFGVRGILINDCEIFFSKREDTGRDYVSAWLFSPLKELSIWKGCDFKACGLKAEEVADFLAYLRRYIFLDRRAGVVLLDGTKQKELQAQSQKAQLLEWAINFLLIANARRWLIKVKAIGRRIVKRCIIHIRSGFGSS